MPTRRAAAPPTHQSQLSPLLHRPVGLAARRPDHDDRPPADGGPRAARDGRPDGRADDGLPDPEPDLLAARRRLGRPPRPPPERDARDGRRPGAADRLDPGRLRVRPPDLDAALRRRVPDRIAQRVLLRRVRRDDPDARAARGLRPGELAHARQPRLLVPRRQQHRRPPRSAAARAVRARRGCCLVSLVGAVSPDGCGSTSRPAHRPNRAD